MEGPAKDDPDIFDFLDGIDDDQAKQEGEVHALTKAGVTGMVNMERHVQQMASQMAGYGVSKMKIDLNMT